MAAVPGGITRAMIIGLAQALGRVLAVLAIFALYLWFVIPRLHLTQHLLVVHFLVLYFVPGLVGAITGAWKNDWEPAKKFGRAKFRQAIILLLVALLAPVAIGSLPVGDFKTFLVNFWEGLAKAIAGLQ